ncbi:conserved membrane hypothetical protein [Desulfamplus magnetovallimortis]|uniref:Uncharacterized protein n=1 Tax=Desulfamplus magnetovallimortis TaxID=1246637 RepID=A0A1W1H5H1_9BACT|nr:conserved membrane hypothetical protein [Desulfamplus magnetovallimortis]
MPVPAFATQMHSSSEGVLVHQLGHLFFLFSMVILYFTIQGKQLHDEKGWRYIQFSALFFVLWNLDALTVHFLDNQTHIVIPHIRSIWEIEFDLSKSSSQLAMFYYFLRLDHLLCLPGMIFLWRGLALLLKQNEQEPLSPVDSNDHLPSKLPLPVGVSATLDHENGMFFQDKDPQKTENLRS